MPIVMIKIKHILLLFSALLLVAIFQPITQVSASAPAGTCYKQTASSSGATEPILINCEGEKPSPGCRITISSSAGQQIEDVDCADIKLSEENENNIRISLNGNAGVGSEIYCGKGDKQVQISFDIGCLGNAYQGDEYNPVLDMLFALLRFVSAGVGLVVIGSIIYAGIQYSASRGNPQTTEAAIKRVANSVIALLLYIFAFALLNFLVPGGLFV